MRRVVIGVDRPHWDEVKVIVFEPDLDRDSGMVVMGALVHRYERTATGLAYAGEEDARAAGLPPGLLQQLRIH